MITLKLPIKLNDEDKKFIHELQEFQSPMIRSAYKLASREIPEIEVRGEIRERFIESKLDSWFQQSAVKAGSWMYKADVEIGKLKNEDKSPIKRVFGGKLNFIRRCKDLISNAEWKEARLLPIYSIGESDRLGNRKFNLEFDKIEFKPWHNKKVFIQLPKMRKNWKSLWETAVKLAKEKKIPITISLDTKFVYLSFDDSKVKEEIKNKIKPIKNRFAGIDLNPNYIGISVFDKEVLIETKLFSLKELTGKHTSASKLEHETREIGHSIGQWLRHLRVDKLFIESLSFKQGDKKLGKNFNRLTQNQWKRASFEAVLSKYFKLYKINAAYTSTIGNILNQELPDPIASSTEIAKRGYRIVILKNKQFYPKLPDMGYLKDLWKESDIPLVTTWPELHSWVKNSKLKYRVPIPSVFRTFSSPTSYVGVL